MHLAREDFRNYLLRKTPLSIENRKTDMSVLNQE